MATYLGGGKIQEFLNSGAFDVGGTIETFVAGTSTHRVTYPTLTDALNGTNPNADWPLELDARGTVIAAINGPTDVIYKNSAGSPIWTIYGLDSASYNIFDSQANPLLLFDEKDNAVNYVQISNAAVGGTPKINVAGDDVNVGLDVSSKGSDPLSLDGGATGKVRVGFSSTGDIELWRAAQCKSTLSVDGAADFNSSANFDGGVQFNDVVNFDSTKAISILPVGMIIAYAGTNTATPPLGWFFCNGSAVSRTTYSALFNALGSGTAWGTGDGSTTFNLPDFRGYTLVGRGGTSDALLGNTVGSAGGERSHQLTVAELAAHTHQYTVVVGTTAVTGGGVPTPYTAVITTNTGSTGGDTAHNNIQPSKIVQWLIKAF